MASRLAATSAAAVARLIASPAATPDPTTTTGCLLSPCPPDVLPLPEVCTDDGGCLPLPCSGLLPVRPCAAPHALMLSALLFTCDASDAAASHTRPRQAVKMQLISTCLK